MQHRSGKFRRFRRRMARWARRSKVLSGLLIVPSVVVVIVTLPITLPLVALMDARKMRRCRRAVEDFACLACGNVLGAAALARADEIWAEHVERLQREKPGYIFRLVRRVRAVCVHCGARYDYDDDHRTFRALSADEV